MASIDDLKSELESVSNSLIKIQREVTVLLERQDTLRSRKEELSIEINRRETVYAKSSKCNGKERIVWNATDFEWSCQLKTVLWERFGIRNLREMQLETINATLSGRDVILIMPTGGGKSLCYQAPALLSGLTLVVSPLLSLIEDQMLSLENLGIRAAKLTAASTKEEVATTHREMVSKDCSLKLLYVTPEKISKSKRFMAKLETCYKSGNLSRIAIDEVHCASQWGNDFRPDYKILGILKRQFPNTPILGLTATSTEKVTLDTMKILNIPFALVFKTSLNRPNLFYEVRTKPDSYDGTIEDICLTIDSLFPKNSGIIYCFSCKNCEDVCDSLKKRGIAAGVYHARLESDQRCKVHKLWLEDKIKVICATVAFGMGIDKPDVRFVIHFSMSKSIENYYQESGRAGRDGQPALCLLYYGFADIFKQSTMVLTEHTGLSNLDKVLEYCQNITRCRRSILFSHFGNEWRPDLCQRTCDVCCSSDEIATSDVTEHCKELVAILNKSSQSNERLTGAKLCEAAAGRGKFKTTNTSLKLLPIESVQKIIVHMLRKSYMKEDFHFTPYSTISYLIPGSRQSLLSTKRVELCLHSLSADIRSKRLRQAYQKFCANFTKHETVLPIQKIGVKRSSSGHSSITKNKKKKKIGATMGRLIGECSIDLTKDDKGDIPEPVLICDSDDDDFQ